MLHTFVQVLAAQPSYLFLLFVPPLAKLGAAIFTNPGIVPNQLPGLAFWRPNNLKYQFRKEFYPPPSRREMSNTKDFQPR